MEGWKVWVGGLCGFSMRPQLPPIHSTLRSTEVLCTDCGGKTRRVVRRYAHPTALLI